MKKFISLLVISAILFSCSEEPDNPPVIDVQDSQQTTQIRSIDQAIEIANTFLAAGSVSSRSNANLKAANVIMSNASRSSAGDTLIYALDIEDNNGFVLVAAPKNVDPILAVIDEGSFNDPQNLENKSYQMILEETKDYVANLSSNRIPIDPDPIDTTKLSLDLRIPEIVNVYTTKIIREPLVEVKWDQSYPENIFCQNNIAGCTPIAIAQMLSYFELPKSISYSFPEKDINSEVLNWPTIKKHKSILNCNCTYTNHMTLARVVREIGQRAGTDYSDPQASGTSFGSNVPNAVKELTGLTPDTNGQKTTNLFDALSNNIGVAIVGGVGHSFIADAIKHLKYKTIEYLYNPDGSLDSSNVLGEYNIKLIHYNWGWSGNCNGFFYYDILNPGNAYEYDDRGLNNNSSYVFSADDLRYYLYKSQR